MAISAVRFALVEETLTSYYCPRHGAREGIHKHSGAFTNVLVVGKWRPDGRRGIGERERGRRGGERAYLEGERVLRPCQQKPGPPVPT